MPLIDQIRFGVLTVFAVSVLGAQPARASEPDNFTRRPLTVAELADPAALDALNQKTNEVLAAVLPGLTDCNLQKLHMAVKNALGGGEIGKLEDWAIQEPTLKKTVVPQSESIYADAGIWPGGDTSWFFGTRSIGLALMGIVPSVVLDGHYVGADKLGHFFDQGYAYYEEIYVRHGDSLTAIENLGLTDEDGMNGMEGNGIRSYGDMAANFQGYLFWRSAAGGAHPYYRCEAGKFMRTDRKFDWADYVSDAWDEAINCSEFSPSVEKVVYKQLGNLRCPVTPKACQAILAQTCGYTYLSPLCMPYVRVRQLPDAACARIIAEDAASQICSDYEPGFWRGPKAAFVADIVDAAGTLAVSKGRGLQRNVKKLIDLLTP